MLKAINKYLLIIASVLVITAMSVPALAAPSNTELISGRPQNLPVPGMVTMVAVGAHECAQCRTMIPIIESLAQEYQGRAAIAFIDIWKHRDEGNRYEIHSIPTQIFYDKNGKEKYRHVGFLNQQSIVDKLQELGVK